MDAVAVAIGKGVEAWIRSRSAQLSQRDFTLERNYADWDLELTEMDSLELSEEERLRVDVVTHTLEQSVALSTRTTVQFVVPVDIAIRKKFGANDRDKENGRVKIDAVDAMMLFQQELHLLFAPQRMTDFSDAAWDEESGGTKIVVGPVKQHLRELGQFTGIVRIYFRAHLKVA